MKHEPTGVPLPSRACPRLPRIISVPWRHARDGGPPEVECVFLNPTWHGAMVHHLPDLGPNGRDQPCDLPLVCEHCKRPGEVGRPQFKGYLAVHALGGDRDWIGLAVLCLPHALCVTLTELLERDDGLRGLAVRLKRRPKKRNDSVDVLHFGPSGKEPLPGFDVRPCLENVWGLAGYWVERERRLAEKQRQEAEAGYRIIRMQARRQA